MSVINVKHKHIFIHIPKCAGWSMEVLPFIGGRGHASLHQISKQPNFNRKFFKWCFIRNPYDRIASTYFAMGGGTPTEIEVKKKHPTFKQFLMNVQLYLPDTVNFKTKYDGMTQILHILPLDYYIISDNTTMDFIGKYEHLHRDWNTVCDNLNIKHSLPHKNKTKNRKDYFKLYDSEMKDVIETIYKSELEKYYG